MCVLFHNGQSCVHRAGSGVNSGDAKDVLHRNRAGHDRAVQHEDHLV